MLVQLPVCNEGAVALRVAAAACALDWPRDRLTIQLLDDGNEDNHAVLAQSLPAIVPPGVDLQLLRRGDRKGFKAGNLAFGLSHSDAPFVAMFDADFVPAPDFLRRTLPVLLADDGLAFVQTRWGHANRNANWLTRVQGLLLDSHFAVEQEARFRAGLPMAFNGSAGVWNRLAIEQSGGWAGDTLTEDLDLSMRCVLRRLAQRHAARPGSAGRPAGNRCGLAIAAGALDQRPGAMRQQAAAARVGKRPAGVEEGRDDGADVPVRLLYPGLHQRDDLAVHDVASASCPIPPSPSWAWS